VIVDDDRTAAGPDVESPYVGLTYYTEATADRFFGRGHDASVIISNLRASRLTLLYAESGVGKSSVLRAGVAARLRARADAGRRPRGGPRFVPVVFSSWSDRPVEGLIAAAEQAVAHVAAPGAAPVLPRTSLEDALVRGAEAAGGTLLVILDQFEEYFLYRARERGVPFAEQFARCVNRTDIPANFLIAIREDAYAGLGDLFRGSLPNVYANFLHLDFLDLEGARDAITKPLGRLNELHPGGVPFAAEDDLVDAVLAHVRRGDDHDGGASSPPRADGTHGVDTTWLQLVMTRLYDEELAAGSHVLRAATLAQLGGAQEIIETHLDRTMLELRPAEQGTAAAAFRFLVTQSGTKIALTVADLAELAELEEAELEPVLRRLAAHDLRILRPVARSEGGTAYEISHDALARPIVDWRRRHDAADLAARLEAERVEKERAQQEAAEASARAARERRRKRIAIGFVVALVAACLAVAVALVVVQSRNADRQRRNAAAQRAIAAAQRRVDASIQSAERIGGFVHTADFGPAAAGVAGLEAERYAPTSQARDRVLALLQVDTGLATIGVGHRRSALAVAYLPSGLVASGSADETVRLWDAAGRELGQPLFTGTAAGQVYDLAATRAGGTDLLAAARDDGGVDLWAVRGATGAATRVTTVKAASETERAVAFDAAGTTLASAGDDGRLRVFTVTAGGARARGSGEAGQAIYGLAFSPDGRRVATAGDDGVRVWRVADFARGRTARPRAVLTAEAAESVAWSRDGVLAAGMNVEQTGIRLFDVGGRKRPTRDLTTTDVVDSLAFSADGSVLVSGGDDWNVITWDVASGRPFGPSRMHDQSAVYAVAVSPDGTTIAAADDSGAVRQWPLDGSGALAHTLGALDPQELVAEAVGTDPPTMWDLALTGDGRPAVAVDTAGVRIYDTGSRGRDTGPATAIAAPDGAYAIATAGDLLAFGDGAAIEVWDTGAACRVARPAPSSCRRGDTSTEPFHTDNVGSLAFHRGAGGLLLASGGHDGRIELWNVTAGGALRHLSSAPAFPVAVDDVAFSPDGRLLAGAGDDGSIRLFRVDDPARPAAIGAPFVGHERQYVMALAFSPDGRTLASGGGDQRVVLWRVDERRGTLRQLQSLFQTNSVLSLAYSPDGAVLAAGDGDDSTCLYDARRAYDVIGGATCLLGAHSDTNRSGVYGVQFAADGHALYTAGEGSPVVAWSSLLWDERAGARPALVANVCRIAARNLTAGEWADAFAGTPLAAQRRATCPASAVR
jgi:WD40 repeat protein